MVEKQQHKTAWTSIADLFTSRDGKSLNGEIRVAVPMTIKTGNLDLVIMPIPESAKRQNGPTHRASLVLDLGPVEGKDEGAGDGFRP